MKKLASCATVLAALTTGASAAHVVVTIENRVPANGTFQTPVWIGFHDGGFDSYDIGTLASTLPMPGSDAIERIAEDGNPGPISAGFSAVVPGGFQSVMASNGPIPPLAPGRS